MSIVVVLLSSACHPGPPPASTSELRTPGESATTSATTVFETPTTEVRVHVGPSSAEERHLLVSTPAGDLLYEHPVRDQSPHEVVLQQVPADAFVSGVAVDGSLGVSIQSVAGVQPGDELWLWGAGSAGDAGSVLVHLPEPVPAGSVTLHDGCVEAEVLAPSSLEWPISSRCLGADGSVTLLAWASPEDGSLPAVAHHTSVAAADEQHLPPVTLEHWNDNPGAVRAVFDVGERVDLARSTIRVDAVRSELTLGSDVRDSWVDGEGVAAVVATDLDAHDRVVVTASAWSAAGAGSFGAHARRSRIVDPAKSWDVQDVRVRGDELGTPWTDLSFDPETGRATGAGAGSTCDGLRYDMFRSSLSAPRSETMPAVDWTMVGPADLVPTLLPDLLLELGLDPIDLDEQGMRVELSAYAFDGGSYSEVRTHPLLFERTVTGDGYAVLAVHDGVCSIHAQVDGRTEGYASAR
ncbi:MAG: hypothetical protein KTR31_34635 [Myxococcales bacterium]|nr:hypothetical protein [Myxococcales bacterium]